jgi:peptidoglycan/xylan/chitin deacetylase (PgdA/CDA1 family)
MRSFASRSPPPAVAQIPDQRCYGRARVAEPEARELPERIRARREAAKRRAGRRRAAAATALGAAALVAGILVADPFGGSDEGGSNAGHRAAARGSGGATATRAAGRRSDWSAHKGPVPILMYHPIQEPIAGAPYPELFVRTEDFIRQMRWLDRNGFEGVRLDQVERAWYGHGRLPRKPVVVSFDDGYASQYVNAFPVLRKLGWPAVLDLKAADSDMPDADVRELIGAGWELASHTISHLDLTTLDPARLQDEVAGSRRILQHRFGVRVRDFCYPAGRYDDAVTAAVKAAGYVGATTTDFGLAARSEPLTLKRIRVELDDGLDGFVEKLRSSGAVS